MENPECLSIDRIAESTGQSRANVYDAIKTGHLKSFLVGRRRFARPAAVRAWVDFLETRSDAGRPVMRSVTGSPGTQARKRAVV
jgi:hypothetical protein